MATLVKVLKKKAGSTDTTTAVLESLLVALSADACGDHPQQASSGQLKTAWGTTSGYAPAHSSSQQQGSPVGQGREAPQPHRLLASAAQGPEPTPNGVAQASLDAAACSGFRLTATDAVQVQHRAGESHGTSNGYWKMEALQMCLPGNKTKHSCVSKETGVPWSSIILCLWDTLAMLVVLSDISTPGSH